MDRLGVDRACVSLGDRLIHQPNAAELREQNAWTDAVVAEAPDRLLGFVYCSPNHPELSLELLEEYVTTRQASSAGGDGQCATSSVGGLSHGFSHPGPTGLPVPRPFVGIKLWVCQLADHPANDPICARAAELGLPVLQHTWVKTTGNLPTESTPAQLVTLARRHPRVNFIMAHAGGDWERGLRTVRHVTNILPDTCGNDPEAGFTELAVRLLGPERLVFGSDATGRSLASQLAKITGAAIGDEAKALILGGNLERLMPA